MKNEQLFVNKPSFIDDESTYDLENTLSSTNSSTVKTYCSCEDQASSTESLNDFNILQCNLTERTEFCSSSSQSGNQINSYSTSCTISKRKRRSVIYRSLLRRSIAETEDSDDITDYELLVYDEDINSTNVVYIFPYYIFENKSEKHTSLKNSIVRSVIILHFYNLLKIY